MINEWFNDEEIVRDLIEPSMKYKKILSGTIGYHKLKNKLL